MEFMKRLRSVKKEEEKLVRTHDDPKADLRVRRDHEVYWYDNRPIVSIFTPVFQTVFTDWFHTPFDLQYDKVCGKIERNFIRCMEAYGSNRGFKQCRDYIDDFRECTSYDKQKARLQAMIDERKRRHKNGESGLYSKPPRMGSYESTEY